VDQATDLAFTAGFCFLSGSRSLYGMLIYPPLFLFKASTENLGHFELHRALAFYLKTLIAQHFGVHFLKFRSGGWVYLYHLKGYIPLTV